MTGHGKPHIVQHRLHGFTIVPHGRGVTRADSLPKEIIKLKRQQLQANAERANAMAVARMEAEREAEAAEGEAAEDVAGGAEA